MRSEPDERPRFLIKQEQIAAVHYRALARSNGDHATVIRAEAAKSNGRAPMHHSRIIPLEELRRAIHRHFAPRRHSALLIAIVATFAVRPLIGDTGAGIVIFGVALVLLLLVALYNINVDELVGERGRLLAQGRRRRIIGWALASAAAAERLAIIFVQNRTLDLVGTTCLLLFILFVTLSQLRSVLRQREVTGETICMAISVYLLLGIAWGFLYSIMFQLHPDSFGGLAAGIRTSFCTFFRCSATSA